MRKDSPNTFMMEEAWVLDNVDGGLLYRVVKRCGHCRARVVDARRSITLLAAQLTANDLPADFPVGHLQYGVAKSFKPFGDEAASGGNSAAWPSSQDEDVSVRDARRKDRVRLRLGEGGDGRQGL